MSDDNQIDEQARMIMRRAMEQPAPQSEEGIDFQLLAQIEEGTLKLDEIDDGDLFRLMDSYGIDEVADAFLMTGQEGARPVTASRSWWAGPKRMALAASFAAVAAGAIVFVQLNGRPRPFDVGQLALGWSPGDGSAPAGTGSWGSPDFKSVQGSPDFNLVSRGIHADSNLTRHCEATVIVRTDDGFGSGAMIDPHGYVITNYHIIASAAQAAAASGRVGVCQVILPHLVDGRLKPASPVSAMVYRVDVEHDLALLKLDNQNETMPFVRLADAVIDNEVCTVIGSQANGPAWWARKTNLFGRFNFPQDLGEATVGGTAPSPGERARVTLLVTDAQVLPGDSGGPLLDENGKLIGLTFATSAKPNAGAVGWHIALQHLQVFLKTIPNQPEGVPFDFWSAGWPGARMDQPEMKGHANALRVQYLTGADPSPVADAIYFDSSGGKSGAGDSLIPSGLWGMEKRGLFQFEVCVLRRRDGLVAVGYVNEFKVLSEIRIATGGKNRAEVVWKRFSDGGWHLAPDVAGQPVLDMAEIHAANVERLTALLKESFASGKK